jgi:hypothetical protein
MRNKVTEKKVTMVEEVIIEESICCNKCGKEYKKSHEEQYCWDAKMQSFSASFGYGSKYDMEHWQFDLCEDCLVEIIKSFKYVPDGFMQETSLYPIEKDHQKVFELWKNSGTWEPFINYTVEELEEYRGVFRDEYIDKLIEKCKNGYLEY